MNPITNPDAYDVIILNGKPSPGLAGVFGANDPRKWDERNGLGLSGATLYFMGNGLAEFSVKIRLWLPEHWDAWDAWAPLIAKTPYGVRPSTALLRKTIYHPFLAELGISDCVVLDQTQWDQVEHGIYEKEIKFKKFRAPTPAMGKPIGTEEKEEGLSKSEKWAKDLTGQLDSLAQQ